MKTLLKFSLIFLSFFLLLVMSSYCQFVPIALTNFWGETDNNQKIEAIGIGDYSNTNVQPNAALDITIPYLFVNSPPLIYPGEAIRSTAEADYNHTWKMFTYPERKISRDESENNARH